MTVFVEVAVNVPQVSGPFHYHLPVELEGYVGVGYLVKVPFGKQTVHGVVLRFIDQPEVAETRPVLELVDPHSVLTAHQLKLASHLSRSTLAPLAACIDLMLPPGLGQEADIIYTLRADSLLDGRVTAGDLPDNQRRLVTLLQDRGPLRGQQIDHVLRRMNWRSAARSLARRGLVDTLATLPEPKVHPKRVRMARLACTPDTAEAQMHTLGKAGTQALERRKVILRYLMREPGAVQVSWLYAESGGNLSDLQALAERGLITLGESEVWRDPLDEIDLTFTEAPKLIREQRLAWQEVQNRLREAAAGQASAPILLHGVTGSGKTEIYLHALQEVINLGKQAIVLVPEIALTPQTVRRFAGRFPGQVGLLHSGLSDGERYDTWRRARSGELSAVVGPRSALFTPFEKLGLIVVDECHDDTYYQSDILPYYHAREAAISYAQMAGAICLMGSATPDVGSFYAAQEGKYIYLSLPARILAHQRAVKTQLERLEKKEPLANKGRYRPLEAQAEVIELPEVQVVDMRQELKEGNRSIFSRSLQASLKAVLEAEQQAILFLNRRGTATYIFCRDCGNVLKCPRCEIPLTYHRGEISSAQGQDRLLCHYCGYQRKLPARCPQCASERIRHYGTGTERVEAEVQALFPEARTLRWDYETTRKKGAHDLILEHFSAHRADVLIGTQMLAKGLDLPLVTLVGVILADVGLSLPDYRAAERTFQVLTQVAGRAGRSPLGGEVILQSFQPEHYVIQAAARHDYLGFFEQELEGRRKLGYPPFAQIVRLEYRNSESKKAEQTAQALAAQLQGWLAAEGRRATQIIGPAPCFFGKMGGHYRWQIVLRGPEPASLLRGHQLGEWRLYVDPPNLL